MILCRWCREHPASDPCPAYALLQKQPALYDPSSDADDALESLRLRMIGWKVVAGQLIDQLKAAGRQPKPEIVALYPEPLDP